MAKLFSEILPALREFIERQHIFFTASAAAGSRVNVSPRGADALRVLGPNWVAYLDQTGSGNETAAHMRADGRLTIMFCAFVGAPTILRLYGRGRSVPRGTAEYAELLGTSFNGEESPGARQIVVQEIDLVQTSCGYGVPLFDHVGEQRHVETMGDAPGRRRVGGIPACKKNAVSIDGLRAGIE